MTYSMDRLSQRHIYIAAVLLSFLLSFIGFNQQFLPNIGVDGVLYLRCAAAYNEGGLKAAMALYTWPFYSIIIAHLHQLGLSYITAARLLDVLLQAWMVYFFIRIVLHFNPTPRVGLWALLCIICYSTFNGERGLFLRDFGYWAFYLTSFWTALAFLKTERQHYLWLFGLSTLVAALFRIEGVVIALCAIVLFFFMPGWSLYARCRNSFIMAWPFWLGAVLFLLIGSHNLYGGGRLQDIYNVIVHGVTTQLLHNQVQVVALMNKALKPNYVFVHIEQMYFSMLIGFFIYKLVICTEVIYSGLAVYGWAKKALVLNRREKILWYGLMIIQILILFVFLMNHLFLTSRYVLALSLLILLWTPFGIEQLYQKALISTRKWRISITIALSCFFIFSLFYSFVHIGPSKQYLSDATRWLQQYTAVNDRIAVNEPIMLYRVKGAIPTWNEDLFTAIQDGNCQFSAYRYVAVKFRHEDPLAHCTNLRLLQSYHNEKDFVANIYEVRR